MGQFNIPKLSRNRYNHVKGTSTEDFITQTQLMASGGGGNSINSNTISQNAQLSSAVKTTVRDIIDDAKSYADLKASSSSADTRNASYYYTDTSVSELRTGIADTLARFAWPCDVVNTNYTFSDMPVNTVRPVLIDSSTTVSMTTPGDSSQSFVLILFNVMASVLAAAGKNPRYITVAGGTTTQVTWTSAAEPLMLCFLVRTE